MSEKSHSAAPKTRIWLIVALCVLVVAIAIFFLKKSSSQTDNTVPSVTECKNYTAVIDIKDYGTIIVALDGSAAPQTVSNFVALAKDGFYDGLTFHRIISGFMMQGGDPTGTGIGGSDKTIYGEFAVNGFENPLKHTRGAISMARASEYNSASSQFFIVHQDSPHLDGQYAAFGYVTDGMDVVDKICETVVSQPGSGMVAPEQQPVITSITVTEAAK